METQKSYYITTEKMSVGYDGKPLIEEVEIIRSRMRHARKECLPVLHAEPSISTRSIAG